MIVDITQDSMIKRHADASLSILSFVDTAQQQEATELSCVPSFLHVVTSSVTPILSHTSIAYILSTWHLASVPLMTNMMRQASVGAMRLSPKVCSNCTMRASEYEKGHALSSREPSLPFSISYHDLSLEKKMSLT